MLMAASGEILEEERWIWFSFRINDKQGILLLILLLLLITCYYYYTCFIRDINLLNSVMTNGASKMISPFVFSLTS